MIEHIFQADYELVDEREVCRPDDTKPCTESDIDSKFDADVNALCQWLGVDELTAGMSIALNLREALSIMPRRRQRRDSYTSLQKYLHDTLKVKLTINKK